MTPTDPFEGQYFSSEHYQAFVASVDLSRLTPEVLADHLAAMKANDLWRIFR